MFNIPSAVMPGLDDYQFYTNLKDKESPFWQKLDNEDFDGSVQKRPKNFTETLKSRNYGADENDSKEGDGNFERCSEASIMLISVCAENLLSHPSIVMRRQCQVNVSSHRYHLQPFTLMPVMIHLQRHQGLSCFWKGLGSVLTVKGVTLALEDCISKFTPWPKEISPHSSLKTIGQHLLLKSAALGLVTPFYSASLVETVQSEITSERPGVFDVFKEGLLRLLSFAQPQTGRILPVWLLVGPTVVYGVSHYVIGNIASTLASKVLWSRRKWRQNKKGAVSKDHSFVTASVRLQSAFVGHFCADLILFPLETLLHRMHLQGTRTIIDSLDAGYEVKPILTRYEGFFDCLSTTVKEEGSLGLFKGLGALFIQYAVYGLVLKLALVIVRDFSDLFSTPKPAVKVQGHVSPLAPGASYTQISAFQGSAGGSSSLHSSPKHSTKPRVQYGHHLSGSVDLGDLRQGSDLLGDIRQGEDIKDYDDVVDSWEKVEGYQSFREKYRHRWLEDE